MANLPGESRWLRRQIRREAGDGYRSWMWWKFSVHEQGFAKTGLPRILRNGWGKGLSAFPTLRESETVASCRCPEVQNRTLCDVFHGELGLPSCVWGLGMAVPWRNFVPSPL
jgi:hypothetical protein